MPDNSERALRDAELDELVLAVYNQSDKTTSAYHKACETLIEHAYETLLMFDTWAVEEYPDTFMETLQDCLRSFCPDRGTFSHYFNHRWDLAQKGESRGEKMQKTGMTEWDIRMIGKYRKVVNSITADYGELPDDELFKRVADAMGVQEETVRRYAVNDQFELVSDTQRDENGEEFSLSDLNAVLPWEQQSGEDDSADVWLVNIQDTFRCLQERQKPLIRDLLTVKMIDFFRGTGTDPRECHFINQKLYRECSRMTEPMTQREIAARHGKDEASVSRTWKNFLEKLNKIHK